MGFQKGELILKRFIIHMLPLFLIAILIAKTTSIIESVQYVFLIIIFNKWFSRLFLGKLYIVAPFKKNPNKKKLFFI